MFHELRDLDGDVIARAHDTDERAPNLILYGSTGAVQIVGVRAIATLKELCEELLQQYDSPGDDDADK